MKFVTYVHDALSPGGTPKRYLIWVSIILIVQALASIVPSRLFLQSFNYSHVLLGTTILLGLGANVIHNDKHKILAAYFLYIVGLGLSTVTISTGITSLSGIIFMLTWAMTLFIAERREYISFNLVALFMVLMLISTVVLLLFEPTLHVVENVYILGTGALLTGINIYLVYSDFGLAKNYYQETRISFNNLHQLSSKLSEILSAVDEMENLLWKVSKECVPYLGLDECVFYLYDKEKNRLVQVAAYGRKSTDSNQIINPLAIEPGKGIVGKCFVTGEPQLIDEIKDDTDYIVDDVRRCSELAVPIFSNGEVIGVMDSEHFKNGFFRELHLEAFTIIAAFCGIKITEYRAYESIREAELVKEEAVRIKELDDLKNKFITNISHDLKTPLSLIKAPAMQINKISKDKQVLNHANYILKNTEHLLRVVNQLLQLNRVDKGLNELYTEEIAVDHLVAKIATQYRGLAEKDAIVFTASSDAITMYTDAFRLEQIIHNLVHNAFRYTGKNGKISLIIEKHKDQLLIKVSDNGPGIAPEMKNKVFDRFVKIDVNNHEGTGIGLSLVREYARSLNGEVSLESTLGEGTTFSVRLPINKNMANNKDHDEETIAFDSTNKPVLLVVEDHADLNEFICSAFEHKFQCIAAFDGEEALRILQKTIPDIIVTDLMMPKMEGSEFIRALRENDRWNHIPIIVLSAKGQVESKVELYDLGVDNYLVKPFDIEELEAVINSTCEQRRRLSQLFQRNYLFPLDGSLNNSLNDEDTPLEKNDLVSKTVAYVLENLDDAELNVTSIGKALNVGRNKLQKEIKEATSLTPVEFLRSIRLSEARKLLADPQRQVSEVAYMVGFNNLSYFSRAFKNEYDLLPSEWQMNQVS